MSRIAHAALWLTLLMVLSTTAAPLNVSNENVRMNAPGGEGGEGASVTLTDPVGGEVYNANDDEVILFHNSGLTEILVELKLDSTTGWSTLGTRAMGADESSWWNWVVPNHPTTTAQVRVSSASDSSINDVSDYFTILGAGPCDNVSRNVVQWDSTFAANPGYGAGTPVEYTLMSGNVWVSLIDNNGNIPGAGDGWVLCTCEELANGNVWSSNTAYGTGDVVAHNGQFWISAFSPNNGNEPGVVYDAWRPCMDENVTPCELANGLAGPWYDDSVIYYSLGDVVEYPANSGNYYVSTRNSNSAHPNMGELRGWTPCSCRDLWDGTTYAPGTTYSAYQIVYNQGEFYVRKPVNIVSLGGDPEPGGTWSKVWRLCMPSTCKDRSIGMWNTVDRDALLYDTKVVVRANTLIATYWISLIDDNQDPPGADTWRRCGDPLPTHVIHWEAIPIDGDPTWGGVVLRDVVEYRSAILTVLDGGTAGSSTEGRLWSVLIDGVWHGCTFKDSTVHPPTYSNCKPYDNGVMAPESSSDLYVFWTDGTHTDGEEAPSGAQLHFPGLSCSDLAADTSQYACEDMVAIGQKSDAYDQSTVGELNGCWVEALDGSITFERPCPSSSSVVTQTTELPPIFVSECQRNQNIGVSHDMDYREELCGSRIKMEIWTDEGSTDARTSGREVTVYLVYNGCIWSGTGVNEETATDAARLAAKADKFTCGMYRPPPTFELLNASSTNSFVGASSAIDLEAFSDELTGLSYVSTNTTSFPGVTCSDMGIEDSSCEDVVLITYPDQDVPDIKVFNTGSYLSGGSDTCWIDDNQCVMDGSADDEIVVKLHLNNPSNTASFTLIQIDYGDGISLTPSGGGLGGLEEGIWYKIVCHPNPLPPPETTCGPDVGQSDPAPGATADWNQSNQESFYIDADPGLTIVYIHITINPDAVNGDESRILVNIDPEVCADEDACFQQLEIVVNVKREPKVHLMNNSRVIASVAGKEITQKDATIVGGTFVGTSLLWLIGRRLLGSPA